MEINKEDRHAAAVILSRRANEIVFFMDEHRKTNSLPPSIEYGLRLEMKRLRDVAGRIYPEGVTREDLSF